ncbi:hypothetical protein [Streptomyces anulatus]|uniref:hypothetical protein n=1 Tax=Streptomyces anulatus TaxID=1892 RepID=UPI001C26F40E|nr:hypothetical protein [Streptomyces anulatus]
MPNTAPADDQDLDDLCGVLVADRDEDGPTTYECRALVRHTNSGYSCARGHAHTYAEVRASEGWDYASDPVEAEILAQSGVIGVRADGHPWA